MVTGIGTMQSTAPTIMNGNIPTAAVEPVKRASDNRRSNKPIMEKRRRARINNCLNELKTLILDATKKDPARHSKLEKADILEKTVKYLQDLQRQQSAMSQAADPNIVNKFKAGFTECAKEVDRFHGIDPVVKRRLLQHLSSYLTGVKSEHHTQAQIQQVQIHMLPSSPPGSPEQDQQLLHPQQQQQQQIFQLTPANGCYLKINGVLTYVTPQQMQHVPQCAMPTLVPIPSRTSSTASAASIQSSEPRQSPICYAPPSPANSYEAMDYQATPTTTPTPTSNHHHHHHLVSQQHSVVRMQRHAEQPRSYSPRPLSLVMKKEAQNDEEDERKRQATWRPW